MGDRGNVSFSVHSVRSFAAVLVCRGGDISIVAVFFLGGVLGFFHAAVRIFYGGQVHVAIVVVYPFPAVSGSYNSLFFVRVIGVGLGTSVCVNTGGYLDV